MKTKSIELKNEFKRINKNNFKNKKKNFFFK